MDYSVLLAERSFHGNYGGIVAYTFGLLGTFFAGQINNYNPACLRLTHTEQYGRLWSWTVFEINAEEIVRPKRENGLCFNVVRQPVTRSSQASI